MAKRKPAIQLTEVELELMLILWHLGEGTVHKVLEQLPVSRPMAYTTVSTMIRILEKKGVVASRKVGKAHIYSPRVSKEDYEASALGKVMHTLFSNPVALVARLVDDHELSAEEITEIKKLLNRKQARKS